MARIIKIPIAFEFQPQRAKWSMRRVVVRGWAKDRKRGLISRYLGLSDDLVVDISDLVNLYGTLGLPLGEISEAEPAVMHWRDLPAAIRQDATPSKSMEQICGRDFEIFVCETPSGPSGEPDDGWAMRREFIKLKQDYWALLQFLRKWGVWDGQRLGSLSFATSGGASRVANFVVPDGIWELQRRYREALVNPPAEWLIDAIDPLKGAYGTPIYPHFLVQNYQCRPAIEATITIDRLQKVKFRKCKRHDCVEIFELESRHKRLYCGQPCAHLESVRKQRRAAAKLKKKSATKKGA